MLDLTPCIRGLLMSMDKAARLEFREFEQLTLRRSMALCGMSELPEVTGEPNGERCSGQTICEKCGQDYFSHPMDWRQIGYGNVPFNNILCSGKRVKL